MVGLIVRKRRRMLLLANTVLLAAIVASVGAALYLPLAGATEMPWAGEAGQVSESLPGPTLGPLAAYGVIHQRDLNRPLFDPPPAPVVKVEPPPPQLTIRLIGTAVEPGFTYALFRTSSGEERLVRVGEVLEGAEVTAVGDRTATVKFHGRLLKLEVEAKPPPTRPTGRSPLPAPGRQR